MPSRMASFERSLYSRKVDKTAESISGTIERLFTILQDSSSSTTDTNNLISPLLTRSRYNPIVHPIPILIPEIVMQTRLSIFLVTHLGGY